ncbi:hypothetical protein [Streptomyces sp. NPDC057580]|uniref:hypothetical protein n=1 Tax=Streptomyces sp. NPDC057580 TaxID=3346173 RepID=UPI0036748030
MRSPRLAPLAQVLEQYDNPYSLVLYVRRPGGQLIGDLECTHEALDNSTPSVTGSII